MRWMPAAVLGAAFVVACTPDQGAAPTDLEIRASVGLVEHVTTGGAAITFMKGEVVNRLSFVAHQELGAATADGQFEYTGLIGPIKVEPPKEEPPKQEPPAEEPPKQEPPAEEPPKEEPPKEEPPIIETEGQIHGIVRCFMILKSLDGSKSAVIAGVITHSSDPKLVGREVFWDVTDNGEGAGAPADLSSILFPGESKTACLKLPVLPMFKVETGNVQVHPSN